MKTTEQILIEGNELKTYRKLMGFKQIKAAKILNTEQGNYCRMEQGRLNSGDRLFVMRGLFYVWRRDEIKRLKQNIKYLESFNIKRNGRG